MFDFIAKKCKNKTKYLNDKYGGVWKYDGHFAWNCDDGRYVWRIASMAPRYDGDDDSYVTEYWMYGTGMTPIRINWL